MQILIIDFYDSFIFNLVHYFESLGIKVVVVKDLDVNLNQLEILDHYAGIVLSPGPGLPTETHSMFAILKYCAFKIPVFGVCLGMQGIAQMEGGFLQNLEKVRHGKKRRIVQINNSLMFHEMPTNFMAGLYHSWSITGIDGSLICAKDDLGIIMGVENRKAMRYGVQFHPESILTEGGQKIIENIAFKIFS